MKGHRGSGNRLSDGRSLSQALAETDTRSMLADAVFVPCYEMEKLKPVEMGY